MKVIVRLVEVTKKTSQTSRTLHHQKLTLAPQLEGSSQSHLLPPEQVHPTSQEMPNHLPFYASKGYLFFVEETSAF